MSYIKWLNEDERRILISAIKSGKIEIWKFREKIRSQALGEWRARIRLTKEGLGPLACLGIEEERPPTKEQIQAQEKRESLRRTFIEILAVLKDVHKSMQACGIGYDQAFIALSERPQLKMWLNELKSRVTRPPDFREPQFMDDKLGYAPAPQP